jgi:RNA polymerase sigma factor (TIGR02999 family)
MATPSTKPVTQLLRQWRAGNQQALDQLMSLVYNELHRLASHYMKSERQDHTLQATALVNEAFIRLVDLDVPWQDRTHFFAVAARLLRRILVDHAKSHRRAKRAGGQVKMTLDEVLLPSSEPDKEIIALDDALKSLAAMDERKGQLVELHFFGGLTYDEMAEAVGISQATVHRELRLAKAWLYHELRKEAPDDT